MKEAYKIENDSKLNDLATWVDFGEKSVKQFGQWPFDRRDIAKTINKLKENGAAVIVMPILFSENNQSIGHYLLP